MSLRRPQTEDRGAKQDDPSVGSQVSDPDTFAPIDPTGVIFDVRDDDTRDPDDASTGSSVSPPDGKDPIRELVDDHEVARRLDQLGWRRDAGDLGLEAAELAAEVGGVLEETVRVVKQHVDLVETAAIREFLGLPMLLLAAQAAGTRIHRFERRSGLGLAINVDYWLPGSDGQLLVETRFADLDRAFLFLALQLVVAHHVSPEQETYGVVTAGGAWRFAKVVADGEGRRIVKDFELFGVPSDHRGVVGRMVRILT